MSRARIIFVPGLNPKPPPDVYRPQLLRVLYAGVGRARPAAAAWLAAHPEALTLVAWTYLFYGAHRDFTVDLPGIERLLTQDEPSDEDLRELRSWRRRLRRLAHVAGDRWPFLGRRLADANMRRLMHEANRYMKNRDGSGTAIRAVVRETLDAAWRAGEPVLLIGHSLGSVIAYDTLWEASRDGRAGPIELFMTLGSPIGTRFVQRSLLGGRERGAARYPSTIRRWINFTARGDTTALVPRLAPLFREMVELGLLESIEDHVDFDNYFRGELGLNAHDAYGYLAQGIVGDVIGAFIESHF